MAVDAGVEEAGVELVDGRGVGWRDVSPNAGPQKPLGAPPLQPVLMFVKQPLHPFVELQAA